MVDRKEWVYEEILASVDVYLRMRKMDADGVKFVKIQECRKIGEQLGRSAGSIEYRMQNISYVLHVQGRDWISGWPPRSHAGANVAKMIERALAEVEGQEFGELAAFDAQVEKNLNKLGASRKKKKLITPPKGKKKPKKKNASSTQYDRDPEVVAWVLDRSKGSCECCESSAPFVRPNNSPFLEVHHIIMLADGGPDTISNAVAICPNCHRELHYGKGKKSLASCLARKTAVN